VHNSTTFNRRKLIANGVRGEELMRPSPSRPLIPVDGAVYGDAAPTLVEKRAC
jgi:hypothetical protein